MPDSARQAAHEYSDDQTWIPWSEAAKRSLKFAWQLGLNFAGSRLPYAIQKYLSAEWARAIQRADASGKFDLIVCDFLTPAVNLYYGGYRPQTPVLLFQHNVESLIWQRHYETAQGGVRRSYMHSQWQRMVKFERLACSLANQVCAVSEEDARLLREQFSLTNVCGAVPGLR